MVVAERVFYVVHDATNLDPPCAFRARPAGDGRRRGPAPERPDRLRRRHEAGGKHRPLGLEGRLEGTAPHHERSGRQGTAGIPERPLDRLRPAGRNHARRRGDLRRHLPRTQGWLKGRPGDERALRPLSLVLALRKAHPLRPRGTEVRQGARRRARFRGRTHPRARLQRPAGRHRVAPADERGLQRPQPGPLSQRQGDRLRALPAEHGVSRLHDAARRFECARRDAATRRLEARNPRSTRPGAASSMCGATPAAPPPTSSRCARTARPCAG